MATSDAAGRYTYQYSSTDNRMQSTILNWLRPTSFVAATDSLPPTTGVASGSDANLRFDFLYDEEGRQTEIRKPGGQVLLKRYDADGRLTFEFDAAMGGVRQVKAYTYDSEGRVVLEKHGTAPVATLDNPATHVYTRQIATTHDPKWGRASTKTFTGGAHDRREVYTYDPEWGDLMAVETYAIGAARPSRTESWTYDGQGRMVSKTSPEGRLTYGYDSQGRLNRIGRGDGRQTRYEYDKQGNLLRVIDRAMGLDPSKESAVVYTYDRHGRKRVVQYPNGARATWQYDDLHGGGQVSEIAHYGKNESNATVQLLKLVYTRDASGLILKIAETGPDHAQTWVYGYDGLKRLTSANRYAGYFPGATATTGSPASSYSYLYDRNGNRTSKTVDGVTTSYLYNGLDQLVSEWQGATQMKSYTWDNGGRMASETDLATPQLSRVYTWTADDRLAAVRLGPDADDPVIQYAYDYLGTRVGRSALDSGDDPDPDETR
ncbi:hypothetical protein GC173_17550 [bacterium]|nr:hypothetical protein [bacterium]